MQKTPEVGDNKGDDAPQTTPLASASYKVPRKKKNEESRQSSEPKGVSLRDFLEANDGDDLFADAKESRSDGEASDRERQQSVQVESTQTQGPSNESDEHSAFHANSKASNKESRDDAVAAKKMPPVMKNANPKTEAGTEVGSLVYAKWENAGWYFGEIVNVKLNHYSILFFDGDFTEKASRTDFLTMDEYRRTFERRIPQPPKAHVENVKRLRNGEAPSSLACAEPIDSEPESDGYEEDDDDDGKEASVPMSLEDLLELACGDCDNCRREDCGKCASCISNRESDTKVCIQKMCIEIPEEDKAQLMPACAKFPQGWKYLFDPKSNRYRMHMSPEGAVGLRILPPSGKFTYYTVERASKRHHTTLKNVDAKAFYKYVGVESIRDHVFGDNSQKKPSSSGEVALYPLGPDGTCGRCENCRKPGCTRCAMCKSDEEGRSKGCFQKMCYSVPIDDKAREAVGFPSGWRFHFSRDNKWGKIRYKETPCLFIIQPNKSRVFRTAEAAVSNCKLGDGVVSEFYNYVGLGYDDRESIASAAMVPGDLRDKHPLDEYDEMELPPKPKRKRGPKPKYKKPAVGSRVYCRTPSSKWRWGIITRSNGEDKDSALYSVHLEHDGTLIEGVGDKHVMTEDRFRSRAQKEPPPPPPRSALPLLNVECNDEVEEPQHMIDSMPEESVADENETSTDHPLVGRDFSWEWTDLDRHKKVVYGTVTECIFNSCTGEAISFKVTYNPSSRRLVNSLGHSCKLAVPESQMIPAPLVFGGCIRAANLTKRYEDYLLGQDPPFHWTWIEPDLRHEELVENRQGKQLPRQTLLVRGFQLVLNVKQSSISNAGYGVFLSCIPLANGARQGTELELEVGELINLGVYAPFCGNDKKLEAVVFAKNFVFNYKCESWAFDALDGLYQMDITDDVTGELHDLAKSHIPAYVNEHDHEQFINVRAEHDPEGSVHYLLGHTEKSQGAFVLPADGREVELFVNYGEKYESVRIRNGYSFASEEKQARIKKINANAEIMDVKEMDRFDADHVEGCVKFFLTLFMKDCTFAQDIIQRALVCAVIFQRRANRLILDFTDDSNGSVAQLTRVLKNARVLVSLLLRMSQDKHESLNKLQVFEDFDEVLKLVFEQHFSASCLSRLEGMMSSFPQKDDKLEIPQKVEGDAAPSEGEPTMLEEGKPVAVNPKISNVVDAEPKISNEVQNVVVAPFATSNDGQQANVAPVALNEIQKVDMARMVSNEEPDLDGAPSAQEVKLS